jgi:hypothetical protein
MEGQSMTHAIVSGFERRSAALAEPDRITRRPR